MFYHRNKTFQNVVFFYICRYRALFDEWRGNGFTFVDNGAGTENDLWVDGTHLQESGKRIIVNKLINSFNHFLESANLFRWYL